MSTSLSKSDHARPADDLPGKVVMVTGAAQGIGRFIARSLAARGAIVGLVDIQEPTTTAEQIAAEGGAVLPLQADVTSPEQMTTVVRELTAHAGGLDALVNGAALFTALERAAFGDLSLDEWDRTFEVNVKSVLICAQAVASHLIASRSGSITNIASNVVSYGAPNFLQYVASKSAIIGMTRSLARELGPHHVRANTVSPGMVTTEVTRTLRDDTFRKQVIATQCIQVPIQPRDVAEVVAFLVSDASRMITGQNILVNGGSHMGPA